MSSCRNKQRAKPTVRMLFWNNYLCLAIKNGVWKFVVTTAQLLLSLLYSVISKLSCLSHALHILHKYIHFRGLIYIHTCQSCVQTPRNFTNGASLAWHLRQRISTVMFTSSWAWPAHWPIRPIFGFWGSKVHKNGRFPALDADELPCKMLRCYLYPEWWNLYPYKQTNKHTVNDISTPCLLACVYNNI